MMSIMRCHMCNGVISGEYFTDRNHLTEFYIHHDCINRFTLYRNGSLYCSVCHSHEMPEHIEQDNHKWNDTYLRYISWALICIIMFGNYMASLFFIDTNGYHSISIVITTAMMPFILVFTMYGSMIVEKDIYHHEKYKHRGFQVGIYRAADDRKTAINIHFCYLMVLLITSILGITSLYFDTAGNNSIVIMMAAIARGVFMFLSMLYVLSLLLEGMHLIKRILCYTEDISIKIDKDTIQKESDQVIGGQKTDIDTYSSDLTSV